MTAQSETPVVNQDKPFTVVLVDYDEDLFTPPDWVGEELARHDIRWVVGQHRTPRPPWRQRAMARW